MFVQHALVQAAAIALMAIGVASDSSAAQPAFDGVYVARGVDYDGHEYRRVVDIEQHGDRFTVMWVEARVVGEAVILKPAWVGIGIATGDALSVSFIAEGVLGIIVYRLAEDEQRLSGRWTLVGDDEAVYVETLIRLPDILPEPTVDHLNSPDL
jgi:hypothetical protein